MQLPTLTVTREDAAAEVQRYRRARRESIVLTREDERMLQAYNAIARGHTVIDLHRALALGGTVTKPAVVNRLVKGTWTDITLDVELPRLCAFRADQRWAWCDGIARDGTVTFRGKLERLWSSSRDRAGVGELRLQAVELFPRSDHRRSLGQREPAFRALLPTVPPHLRPTRNLYRQKVAVDLRGYLVLWEAEWELDRTVPPGDPALLKHLGGTLYRVDAQWDLSPVEQAILAGRRPTEQELRY